MRQLLGYCSEAYLVGESEFLLQLFHLDDLAVFSNELFKTNLYFLKNVPVSEHEQYWFSYNY